MEKPFLLNDLQDKAECMLAIFESLPVEFQMEGLDVFQNVVNAVVKRITHGRVACVKFVPVEKQTSAREAQEQVADLEVLSTNQPAAVNIAPTEIPGSPPRSQHNHASVLPSTTQACPPTTQPSQTKLLGTSSNVYLSKTHATFTDPSAIVLPNAKILQQQVIGLMTSLQPLIIQDEHQDEVVIKEEKVDDTEPLQQKVKIETDGNNVRIKTDSDSDPGQKDDDDEDDDDADDDYDPEEGDDTAGDEDGDDMGDEDDINDEELEDQDDSQDYVPGKTKNPKSKSYLKCRHCPYEAPKPSHLKVHMAIHKKGRKFVCDECGKTFTANSSLKRHKRAHRGEKPYKCEICNKRFIDSGTLKLHSVVHTGERLYSCDQCDKTYTNSANLSRHKRIHTGAMPYTCKECGERFRDLTSHKLHVLKHTGEKPFLCEICNKQFKTSSDFKRHERTHTQERNYKCGLCDKTFIQGWHLKQHMDMHNDHRPWKCSICAKTFRSKASLQHHERWHAGIKNHKCMLCDKSFSTRQYLRDHQVSHTQAKPFECKICGTAFSHLSNMKRHMRVHSEVRRYKCSYCSKTFKFINSWRYHEGIHKGEMLSCDKCAMQFRSHNGLKKHICDPSQYDTNIKNNEEKQKEFLSKKDSGVTFRSIGKKGPGGKSGGTETMSPGSKRPGLRQKPRKKYIDGLESGDELGEDSQDTTIKTEDDDDYDVMQDFDNSLSADSIHSATSASKRQKTLGNITSVTDEDSVVAAEVFIKKEPVDESPVKGVQDLSAVRVKLEVSEDTGNARIIVQSSQTNDTKAEDGTA